MIRYLHNEQSHVKIDPIAHFIQGTRHKLLSQGNTILWLIRSRGLDKPKVKRVGRFSAGVSYFDIRSKLSLETSEKKGQEKVLRKEAESKEEESKEEETKAPSG